MVFLILCVLGTIAYVANFARWTLAARELALKTQEANVHNYGLVEPTQKTLAAKFTDSQGRMLADPPASADQLVDPPTLVLAHIADVADEPTVPWGQFEAYLAKATGKKVEDVIWTNSPEQIASIDQGTITMVALHAADTPFLVNNYGFEPAAVLADAGGIAGHKMDLIVPAGSTIATPADIKGHSLLCTVPSSIVGYRAALVLLAEDESLRPEVDYFVTWSMGQKQSIEGIINKQYDVACVSSDKLAHMLKSGKISPDEYRVIYESQVVPQTTIGWFYNLKPDLAAKVDQAILSFKPTASDGDESDSDDSDSSMAGRHFVATDYKNDFQLVRLIDNRFEPRFDAKTKEIAAAAATQPAGN
ncbi:MAG: PhnD/SsuA/transferrin family substrate-binding protein [Tepidisphaeraceae bacterium]|jgi:phosphonate transport system substrate-binding protein